MKNFSLENTISVIPNNIFIYIILVFLFHIGYNWGFSEPIVVPDETIYLGHAYYFFSGHSFSYVNAAFGSFGFPLFITPILLFFSNPFLVYKAALILNSLLCVLLFWLIYLFIKDLFNIAKEKAMAIAFVTSLYPAIFTQASLVITETISFVLFVLLILLFWKILERKELKYFIFFGLNLGFLYTVHVRSLAFIAAAFLVLIILAILRVIELKKVIWSIIICLALFFVTRQINSHLLLLGWQDLVPYSLSYTFSKLLTWRGLEIFFYNLLGQFLYLGISSFGLFFVAIFYLVNYLYTSIKSKGKSILADNKALVLIFLFLLSGAMFFSSSLFMVFSERLDAVIYGRHNEIFFILFLAIGIVAFYKNKVSRKNIIFSLFSLLVLGFIISINRGDYSQDTILMFNTSGVFPLAIILQGLKLFIISLISIALFTLLIFYFKKSFYNGLVAIVIIFVLMNSINHSYMKAMRVALSNFNDLAYIIDEKGIKNLSYDMTNYVCDAKVSVALRGMHDYPRNFDRWQFLLLGTRFDPFSSQKNEKPINEFVVSSVCWPQAEELAAKQIAVDQKNGQALWTVE